MKNNWLRRLRRSLRRLDFTLIRNWLYSHNCNFCLPLEASFSYSLGHLLCHSSTSIRKKKKKIINGNLQFNHYCLFLFCLTLPAPYMHNLLQEQERRLGQFHWSQPQPTMPKPIVILLANKAIKMTTVCFKEQIVLIKCTKLWVLSIHQWNQATQKHCPLVY